MSAVDLALTRLTSEEGKRKFAYNDATGKTVTCRPQGNLSIGIGVNLETGLDDAEIDFLLRHRLESGAAQLTGYWWTTGLDDARYSVVLDIAYNAGLAGLLHFPKMLAAIGKKDWQTAHDELLNSDAAHMLPARYNALAQILLTGEC